VLGLFLAHQVDGPAQEQANGGWKGRLEPLYLPSKRESPAVEAALIEHDLKWSPVKVLAKTFPQGVGPSSNWRLPTLSVSPKTTHLSMAINASVSRQAFCFLS